MVSSINYTGKNICGNMINKKYELIIRRDAVGHITHRIRALRDFSDVKAGDLGGYVQTEHNLSHGDDCWVSDSAIVYENARVYGNARVCGDALIHGSARVYGNAQVCGAACMFGNARIYENGKLSEQSELYGNARIFGNAQVYGDTRITGDMCICGDAWIDVGDRATFIHGNTKIDHGIWTRRILINDKWCLISTTLEMMLLEEMSWWGV